MMVVAIVAVLAAVAFPAYDKQVQKSHRSEAQQFMVEIANRQAQYLLDARNYAVDAAAVTTLGLTTPPPVATFYTIAVTASDDTNTPTTPPSFKIKATPIATTKQNGDGILTLDHTGAKTLAGSAGW
jgi:type IV pilus assembly protein PilE